MDFQPLSIQGHSLYQTLESLLAWKLLLSSVLVLRNPVPSFLISLRDEKIPRIDARLDSWFYFLLIALGSEDSAADFRTTGMGPYDSQRMMRGRSRGRRLQGKIYKPSARYQTRKQTAGREASQLQVLDGFLVKERSISREDSLNRP
jgi:hypothetical protein